MITLIALAAALGAIAYLLISLVKIVRTCTKALDSVIEEFRLERQILTLQKEIVSSINTQISIQKMMIEKRLEMAMNSISVMKMLQEREKDPKWIQKFDEGRDNAKFN